MVFLLHYKGGIVRYVGSKARLSSQIGKYIYFALQPEDYYYEPFVGGANMLAAISHHTRIGIDIDPYVIALLRAVRDGWTPPIDMSEEEYNDIKNNRTKYDIKITAFAGYLMSFGGKFFGGYSRDSVGTNYAKRGHDALLRQASRLKGAKFIYGDYRDQKYLAPSVIYCDPPYQGTIGYKTEFDHKTFWSWARKKVKDGHKVLVSEYEAPKDFIILDQWPMRMFLDKQDGDPSTEKLFCHESQKGIFSLWK